MKYSIVTFGCRVNQADSLRIEEDLRARGGADVPSREADLVVVNTCSVTATADQGARQAIRRIARDNPAARIVVTGCYASRCASDLAALPNVVQVVGNDRKDSLVSDLYAGEPMPTAVRFGDGDGACGAIEPGVAGRTAFTLRVQTGCDEHCAYCIIPSTRGAGRSTPIVEVVREAERAAACGFKEIALTGVHLGSYGRDLDPPVSLVDLLNSLDQSAADVVFRISSLEPMDCTPAIVDLVASSGGRFAPHFHLPLQHASDDVLAAMRRPYTLDGYRRLVDRVAERVPSASIGSDMIVGFPGESPKDFAVNLAYLPGSPLTHLHVFPYSDRPGTAATAMAHKVDGVSIRERGSALRAIGSALTERFRQSQRGTVRRGLTLEDGSLVVTDNFLKVRIPPGVARNQWVRVRIDEVGGDPLRGTVVGWGDSGSGIRDEGSGIRGSRFAELPASAERTTRDSGTRSNPDPRSLIPDP
jgi:threonylcarbamoyladenosine tRNA methylthiotransferase MtaB